MSTALMELETATPPRTARRAPPNAARESRAAAHCHAATRWGVRADAAPAVADDVVVRYQPRFRLNTGFQTGAEALLHRPPGVVAPRAGFAADPFGGRGGRMTGIEARVLRAACAEAARWGGIGVCVNIGAPDIHDTALLEAIADALDASGLAPDLLELGLSEAMLGDVDIETLLVMSEIRDLGVGLVLDRFDAGPATLRMLERLPLTGLKLDRALVRELPGGDEDAAIAHAIIDAGRALDCIIVADGVATEAQRACLVGLGCQEGQGSLFGAALSAEAMRERLGVD